MSTKLFQRTTENFTCGHCGQGVQGNGYTNHCPTCLWSKHVDVNPGDRAADCGGMMEPVTVELKRDTFIITHRCEHCDYHKRNHAAENDNRKTLIAVAQANAGYVARG